MSAIRAIAAVGSAALLAGCLPCGVASFCPTPSPAFQRVEGLASSERDAALAQLPLEQRLDAYHDVFVRSGHPRRRLSQVFWGSGEAGVRAAIGRMTDRSSFNEYFSIVHTLGLRGEVDICDPRFFEPLAEKARRFEVADPKHPVPVQFDGCVLPL